MIGITNKMELTQNYEHSLIIGSLIGILLPFIFSKFKKDPATASTPLITTLADIIGTGIFLSIAYLILG